MLANPSYDEQIDQINELEKLKLELSRKGVPVGVETLKRGMVLSEREEPPNGGPKKYLRGDEFLMKNPNKKVKKKKDDKKKRHGRSMSPKK